MRLFQQLSLRKTRNSFTEDDVKRYTKEIIAMLIQVFMFYVFPLFVGPTDIMGMVVLIILVTLLISVVIGLIIDKKIKYLYPIFTAVLFVPSVFIYYNGTALIHSVWYLVISSIGLLIGTVLHKMIFKRKHYM